MPRRQIDDPPIVYNDAEQFDDLPSNQYDDDVVVEIGENGVTKKVRLNLEVDTSTKDIGQNPFRNLIHLARALDAWRPFPRLFISVYIYLLYEVVRWAMIQDPLTLEQSGLVSIIVGSGAAWFGLYISGRGKSNGE